MELIVSWVLFPLALTGIALGWGVLAERAGGTDLAGALLPGAGLAAVIVVGGACTATEATAPLAFPAISLGGAAGLLLGSRGRLRRRPQPWALAAAGGAFAVYAAPIVLSGEAGFAGYIKLDDTATWLALTDRVMEHGRSLEGLPGSTYEATLAFNLAKGYPVGAFIPLGAAAPLVGVDVAWLIQPYMAWLAALLALALWELARPLIGSARARAVAACVAAIPALLLGYVLWGGIKEIAAAALIALVAALALPGTEAVVRWRRLAPLALASAALLHVLTLGGIVWLAPILLGALIVAARRQGLAGTLGAAGAVALMIAAMALPLLLTGSLFPPTAAPLDSESARGNLAAPLSPLQALGIWLAGDFRYEPGAPLLTYALVTAVLAAAGAGLVYALRRSAPAALYAAGSVLGMAALMLAGSPWVDGKALATASPAFLFLAMAGCAGLVARGRRSLGWSAGAVIVAGVLASAALAYREVTLGPRDQLAELERIGELTAGEGPLLITEYQPYATRHFLREADPEAPSELRRRVVPLAGGGVLAERRSADTDELALRAVLAYRTLVLRRGPTTSRPPSPYRLIWSGEHYEVWQRPLRYRPPAGHLALGVASRVPTVDVQTAVAGVPDCTRVARLAGRGEVLLAAAATSPLVLGLSRADAPERWRRLDADPALLFPDSEGSARVPVRIERAGVYELWLGGSVRGELVASVDGVRAGSVRQLLNNLGQYLYVGSARLRAGQHTITLRYGGPDLHPGSAGTTLPIGPLVLARGARSPLVRVGADRARELCGREWDWIETAGGD